MAIAWGNLDRTRALTRILVCLFVLLVGACSTAGTVPTGAPASVDGEQAEQGFVVFTDIPMPADASVQLDRTIVLGTGVKGTGVIDVAKAVFLKYPPEQLVTMELSSLEDLRGLGRAKAGLLVAAFELARRGLGQGLG